MPVRYYYYLWTGAFVVTVFAVVSWLSLPMESFTRGGGRLTAEFSRDWLRDYFDVLFSVPFIFSSFVLWLSGIVFIAWREGEKQIDKM